MAVKTLNLVFRYGSIFQQLSDAVSTCEWVAIPSDRRRGAIELWKVYTPRWRIVRGVIQTSELICSTGCNFDAVKILETEHEMNETCSHSSRVRVLILSECAAQDLSLIRLNRLSARPKY